MPSRRRLRSVGLGFVVAACLTFVLPMGCSEQPPHLDVKVASSVGRLGECASCQKKIETVSEKHLLTVRGIQYTVCDEQCTVNLKKWLAKQ